jgi:acetolactate synthase-1/2/3 large subunit
MDGRKLEPTSVAESLLQSLKAHGVDYVFANAGTDFAPIIEALVKLGPDASTVPTFITVPHENLAVAMAHGYYLASGKPAAAMVHVTVGTGNTVCALMNAYRDQVPLLLMAGRTPHTQEGHIASRSYPIHWGQENFDQAGMVREYTKWDYELRAGQDPTSIVGRALEVAFADARGPVYLTLPREVLANADSTASALGPEHDSSATGAAPMIRTTIRTSAQPDPAGIVRLAEWIAAAERPVIVTSHLGRDTDAVAQLASLVDRFALPVIQAGPTCINLPASHPMNLGQAGGSMLAESDCIIVADSEVPWFPAHFTPAPGTLVAHLGVDPTYQRYPIRSFPSDLTIPGNTKAALQLLELALTQSEPDAAVIAMRRARVAAFQQRRTETASQTLKRARDAKPISYAYLGACLREALPAGGIVVTELGASSEQLGLEEPGSLIGVGIGGGLGFGLGAALGAKLAVGERPVVATVGDGSYMFGNPTPFHFVARAAKLPVLVIVCNNSRWQAVEAATRGVYPHGAAAASAQMPLVELKPSPEFTKVAEASDAFAVRVDDPAELKQALGSALAAVASGRQALLDLRMEHGVRSKD